MTDLAQPASPVQLPVGFVPLLHGQTVVGAIGPEWQERVAAGFHGSRSAPLRPALSGPEQGAGWQFDPVHLADGTLVHALSQWADDCHTRGWLPGWRNEPMEPMPGLRLERALLRPLGLLLHSIQVNGFTTERLWFQRRSPHKAIDPGRFDALVGGGLAAGESIRSGLLRECREEAGIGSDLTRTARPVGALDSQRPEEDHGCRVLHRERLFLFDLLLPAGCIPINQDGEVVEFVSCRFDRIDPLRLAPPPHGDWTVEGAWATQDLLARRGHGSPPNCPAGCTPVAIAQPFVG